MMAVPLVRPSLPDQATWLPKWQHATKLSGQFSNFGPMWHEVSARLSSMTGRIALPCSSGTEAVALGIVATAADTVAYEAFTFEATGIAARRIDRHPTVLRTNAPAEEECVVRTVPFGLHRTFRPEVGQTALVIDAAGAFDGTLDTYPTDAVIACSFHATKNFPIGEGGCVFLPANCTWAVNTVKRAMNFGIDPATRELGGLYQYRSNAKLDELHCAMLLSQLDRVTYFRERSLRIRMHSQRLAEAIPGAWLPYDPGRAQSLVVVVHRTPAELCETLERAGFIARPVYMPNRHESLLRYEESHLVAFPSDMTDAELEALIEVAQVERWRVAA